MNPAELFDQAELLAGTKAAPGSDADLRRAVSALYYALFHMLSADAAAQVTPASSLDSQSVIRRTISHVQIRRACEAFRGSSGRLPKLWQALLQSPLEPEFDFIASTFVDLQEARYQADYDSAAHFHRGTVLGWLLLGSAARDYWLTIRHTPNAAIFLTVILFGDKLGKRG